MVHGIQVDLARLRVTQSFDLDRIGVGGYDRFLFDILRVQIDCLHIQDVHIIRREIEQDVRAPVEVLHLGHRDRAGSDAVILPVRGMGKRLAACHRGKQCCNQNDIFEQMFHLKYCLKSGSDYQSGFWTSLLFLYRSSFLMGQK